MNQQTQENGDSLPHFLDLFPYLPLPDQECTQFVGCMAYCLSHSPKSDTTPANSVTTNLFPTHPSFPSIIRISKTQRKRKKKDKKRKNTICEKKDDKTGKKKKNKIKKRIKIQKNKQQNPSPLSLFPSSLPPYPPWYLWDGTQQGSMNPPYSQRVHWVCYRTHTTVSRQWRPLDCPSTPVG